MAYIAHAALALMPFLYAFFHFCLADAPARLYTIHLPRVRFVPIMTQFTNGVKLRGTLYFFIFGGDSGEKDCFFSAVGIKMLLLYCIAGNLVIK